MLAIVNTPGRRSRGVLVGKGSAVGAVGDDAVLPDVPKAPLSIQWGCYNSGVSDVEVAVPSRGRGIANCTHSSTGFVSVV